jgi:hypothetical protein
MLLSIHERITLLELLPREGSFTSLKIVRKLREKLSFTEEEIGKFSIKEEALPDGGMQVHWDLTAAPVDLTFSLIENDLIVKGLKDKDSSQKLTDREFPLFEKFVIE